MKILKQVFGRVWATWTLIIFTGTMFIAFLFYIPCFFLQEPQKARWHRTVSRIWMNFFLFCIACPLQVKGKDYFNNLENCIIVCNHNSLMDVPVTTPFMARANKTIAKKSFAVIPIFGWIYAFGSVLVDRKSEQSRRESYTQMKKMLSYGLDMVIYPEGTRNTSNQPLKSFHDGAFRLATDTGKPVVPAIVFNTRKVLPANKPFYLLPHKLHMHFLPPVPSTNTNAKELKQKVFNIMWNYYEANA